MSRLFPEPSKAEELFQTLDQIKDENIWRILSTLLDSDTHAYRACALRVSSIKFSFLRLIIKLTEMVNSNLLYMCEIHFVG